jgi:hypothetical protein
MKRNFGLVIDWETSGLASRETPWRTYLEGPQGIEIGVIAVELPSFTPLGEFDSHVRFLGSHHGIAYSGSLHESLTWCDNAEKIHGLSISRLMKAPSPTEVSERLIRFVKEATGIDDLQKNPIMLCGHNPDADAYYLRQLLYLGGSENKIRLHSRMIDSFTMGYFLYGTNNSNELFELTSGVKRDTHRALEDAGFTLAAFQHGVKTLSQCRI